MACLNKGYKAYFGAWNFVCSAQIPQYVSKKRFHVVARMISCKSGRLYACLCVCTRACTLEIFGLWKRYIKGIKDLIVIDMLSEILNVRDMPSPNSWQASCQMLAYAH